MNSWKPQVIAALKARGVPYRPGDIPSRMWVRWYVLGEPIEATVTRAEAHLHNMASELERRRMRMEANRYGRS